MDNDLALNLGIIREGIRRRYETYHLLDQDRFPDFEYNTNRANYEPLRTSFEQEFYEVRKLDRSASTIHIPSTNTLALLFTESSYIPNPKILNTCRAYAILPPNPTIEISRKARFLLRLPNNRRVWWLGLAMAVIGLIIYVAMTQLLGYKAGTELKIRTPQPGQVVNRTTVVTGNINSADEVWLVVHPVAKGARYYLQDVVTASANGSWEGGIVLGSVEESPTKTAFEVRAFVKPKGAYEKYHTERVITFDSWPKLYELATKPIVIFRESIKPSNPKKTASKLVITAPRSSQAVTRTVKVTGRVYSADDVWIVVHPLVKGDKYYLQNVVPVSPNGSWETKVIVGTVQETLTDTSFELRAFVNPKGAYETYNTEGINTFDAWPEQYELATESVVIFRKGTKK